MDSKCLRWLRISSSAIFMGGLLYRIRRGLLFYYCCAGVCRYLKIDNRQQARVFLCPFIIIRGELFSLLREISCWIFIHYFINN